MLSNISSTIVLGVASGLVASFLFVSIVIVFNKVVIPWYRSLIYSGVDISGEWESKLKMHERKETGALIIKQKADKISCIMTISVQYSDDDDVEIKVFKLNGKIEDRVIYLAGKNINRKHIGIDIALLELSNGGKKMVGVEAWFSTIKDSIDSSEIEWSRV